MADSTNDLADLLDEFTDAPAVARQRRSMPAWMKAARKAARQAAFNETKADLFERAGAIGDAGMQPAPALAASAARRTAEQVAEQNAPGFIERNVAAAQASLQTGFTGAVAKAASDTMFSLVHGREDQDVDPNFVYASFQDEVERKYPPDYWRSFREARNQGDLVTRMQAADEDMRLKAAQAGGTTGAVAGAFADPLAFLTGVGAGKAINAAAQLGKAEGMSRAAKIAAVAGGEAVVGGSMEAYRQRALYGGITDEEGLAFSILLSAAAGSAGAAWATRAKATGEAVVPPGAVPEGEGIPAPVVTPPAAPAPKTAVEAGLVPAPKPAPPGPQRAALLTMNESTERIIAEINTPEALGLVPRAKAGQALEPKQAALLQQVRRLDEEEAELLEKHASTINGITDTVAAGAHLADEVPPPRFESVGAAANVTRGTVDLPRPVATRVQDVIDAAEQNGAAIKAAESKLSKYEKFIKESVFAKLGFFNDFTRFVNSKSNVVKSFGLNFTEDAAGIYRSMGVATDNAQFHDIFRRRFSSELDGLSTDYTLWARRKGYGLRDVTHLASQGQRDFDRMLYKEMQRRWATRHLDAAALKAADDVAWQALDVEVKRAADRLDKAAQVALDEMRRLNLPGAEKLGETARGYLKRQADGAKMRQLFETDPAKYRQMKEALAQTILRDINENIKERIALGLSRTVSKMVADPNTGQMVRVAQQQPYELMTIEKARTIANNYVTRAENKAMGIDGPTIGLLDADGRATFRSMLDGVMDDEEIQSLIDIMDHNLGDAGRSARLKGRMDFDLSTPDPVTGMDLSEFFVTDINQLVSTYREEIAGRTMFARGGIYSDADLDDWIRAAEATGATKDELKLMKDYWLRARGQRIDGQGDGAGLKILSNWASSSMLSQVGFAQAAEGGAQAAGIGLWRTIKAVPQIAGALVRMRTGQISDLVKEFEPLLGKIGQDHILFHPSWSTDDTLKASSEFVYGLDQLAKHGRVINGYLSGQNLIHGWQRKVNVALISSKLSDDLLAGAHSKRMQDAGISAVEVPAIRAQLQKHATIENGRVTAFNFEQWTDKRAMDKFLVSVHRKTNQLVQTGLLGETSLWMHSDLGRLFTGLRTFPITALNKQLVRNAYMHDTEAMTTVLYGLAVSSMVVLAKHQANTIGMSEDQRAEYMKKRTTPEALTYGAFQYMNASSLFPEIARGVYSLGFDDRPFEKLGIDQAMPFFSVPMNAARVVSDVAGELRGQDTADERTVRAALGTVPAGKSLPMIAVTNWLQD